MYLYIVHSGERSLATGSHKIYPFTCSYFKVNFAIYGSQDINSSILQKLKGHSQMHGMYKCHRKDPSPHYIE